MKSETEREVLKEKTEGRGEDPCSKVCINSLQYSLPFPVKIMPA